MSELADEIRAEADMASRAGQCKRLHDLADRTATLARELAEVRERLARVAAVLEPERCSARGCEWDERGHVAGSGPCVGRGPGCLVWRIAGEEDIGEAEHLKRRLRAALHAPADAPQGGSEGASTGTPTDAGHAGGSDE